MSKINYEKLDKYRNDIEKIVLSVCKDLGIEEKFSLNSGIIAYMEDYKNKLVANAQLVLHLDRWKDDISSEKICNWVSEIMESNVAGAHNNIIDYRDKDNVFLPKVENDINQAACLFREIFIENDDKKAFEHAIEFFGNKYPLISYLFFIKSPNEYLPIRPNNFTEKFELLGLDSNCLKKCTWENYCEYNEIMHELKNYLVNLYGESITEIDAHTFMWISWMLLCEYNEVIEDARNSLPITLKKEYQDEIDSIENAQKQSNVLGLTREVIVKERVNQGLFRKNLLKKYEKCCLCGMTNTNLLIASHIKPWSVSNGNEKLSSNNGFMLCPNHDKLFDRGYISFDNEGKIIISPELSENDMTFLNVHKNMAISINPKQLPFIRYHREYILRK